MGAESACAESPVLALSALGDGALAESGNALFWALKSICVAFGLHAHNPNANPSTATIDSER